MILYHYTCDHGSEKIARSGELRPNAHPLLPVPVVWLTSEPAPDRIGLGLTSTIIRCDRTAWRVRVDTEQADPWHVFARRYRITRGIRDELEAGRWPMSWFVSEDPIAISLCDIGPVYDVKGAA